MKKILMKTLALVAAAALLLTGCATNNSNSDATAAPSAEETAAPAESADAATELRGEIMVTGSTSAEPLVSALADLFMEKNPGVTIAVQGNGSSAGIKAATDGSAALGMSSRELKEEEKGSITPTTLCMDGIAVVVNKENTVANLTKDQIAQIFKGEITNWKDVGGNDAEIVLIGREAGSGTRDGFESITDTKDACQYRQELTSTGDVINTVSQNPDAIGYASLSAVGDSVKALTVGGVEATEATVKDGSYVVQRPFVLVTKEGTELSPAAQAFFDYALSADAASIIAAAGAVAAN